MTSALAENVSKSERLLEILQVLCMYKAHRSFETPLESLEAGLEAVEVAEAQKKNKKKKYCRHGGLNPGPLDCEQSLLTITPRKVDGKNASSLNI